MLTFVLLELSEPENISKLQHWGQELTSAVILAGVDWNWCVAVANNVELVELVCRVVKDESVRGSNMCFVNSDREVAALTLLIPHAQPGQINVEIPATEPTPPHLEQLVEQLSLHFSGRLILFLHHSFLCYEPCDEVVKELTNGR